MYFGKENNTWNGVLLTNIICEDDHNIGFVATETLLEEDREHQSQAWPRHVDVVRRQTVPWLVMAQVCSAQRSSND